MPASAWGKALNQLAKPRRRMTRNKPTRMMAVPNRWLRWLWPEATCGLADVCFRDVWGVVWFACTAPFTTG